MASGDDRQLIVLSPEQVDRALTALERIADVAERAFPPPPPRPTGPFVEHRAWVVAPEVADRLVEEMEMGIRAYNCVRRSGAQTVADVIGAGSRGLMALPNFGEGSLRDVVVALRKLGWDPPEDW